MRFGVCAANRSGGNQQNQEPDWKCNPDRFTSSTIQTRLLDNQSQQAYVMLHNFIQTKEEKQADTLP